MDRNLSCRAILHRWRGDPTFEFPAPYRRFGDLARSLAADPHAARLVDGIVVRIGRGDQPASIDDWVTRFAARRGITLRGLPR